MREDIVLALEYHDLSDERAKALLASPSPLDEIFHDFEKIEGDHMDTIRGCIESRADKNIEAQREALRNLPVYIFSATFAKEHGELETYRASHRANVDCKNAIEDAIANHQPFCLFAFLFLGDGLNHFLLYNVMNLCP